MFKNKRALFGVPAAWLAALLFVAGCAATGAQVKQEGPADAAGAPLTVRDIKMTEQEGGIVVTVEATQPLKYSIFKLDNPLRLALDLPGAALGSFTKNIPVNKGAVSFIKPLPPGETKVSRLEVFLAAPVVYDVKSEGNALAIVISGKPAAPPAAPESAISSAPVAAAAVAEPAAPAPPAPAEPAAVPITEPPAAAVVPVDASGPAATRVAGLDVTSSPQGSQVIVQGNGRLDYEYFLVESKSVVLDIYAVSNGISPLSRKVMDEYIKQIRVGEHAEPRKKVRIVVDLAKPTEYKLVSLGDKILLNFGALAQEPDDRLRASLSNLVTDVYFRPLEDRSVIEIVTAKAPEYQKVESEDPNRLILEVVNSRVAPEAQKTLDLLSLNREVSKVVSFQYKKGDQPVARVVAQFQESVPYRVEVQGNKILVDIPRTKAPAAETVAAVPPEAAAPAGAVLEPAVRTAAPEMAPAMLAAPAESGSQAPVAASGQPAPRQFTGRKLSMDFKDADIQDVLRLIADVSGINFVSNTDVAGKVTIKMNDVPWDQALDVILKTNKPPLAQVQEAENIIRIATQDAIRQEEDNVAKQEENKLKLQMSIREKKIETEASTEETITRSYPIAYAKAVDIDKQLPAVPRDKGNKEIITKSVDPRTNQIFISGPKSAVGEYSKKLGPIIKSLDTPTPAVQIEARIITVTNNFVRSLGVAWGFTYNASNATGNALPFSFPNSVAVGGNPASATTSTTGSNNLLVNLPATNATSGIGLALGHIANTMALDLRISAAEELGQVEILSSPKVLVVQNEKAIVNVGSQLPVPKTDAEGNRTVEWKDVGIKLEVTPQVTADNRVFLDLQVERSRKGADVKTTEGEQFSIDTERAQTKVLLDDGETSVIGGLFAHTKSDSGSSVPGLSRLPFIGALFRSKSKSDNKSELLIFLTPKIVRPN